MRRRPNMSEFSLKKISLIGCGEVGRCYAQAFADAGHTLVALCDHRPDESIHAFAKEWNTRVESTLGDWIGESDLVISAVFGGSALETATRALPLMKKHAIYADFTTADPAHMQQADARALALDIGFADVAILGAMSVTGASSALICAGRQAHEVQRILTTIGAPITVAGSKAGDAATLKLLRSILTKGLEALSVECLIAAEQKGLRPALYDVLADLDKTSIKDFMELSVRTHVIHAKRRLREVQDAQTQLLKAGIEPLVSQGVEALFERTSKALEQAPPSARSVEESLAWLTRHALLKGE